MNNVSLLRIHLLFILIAFSFYNVYARTIGSNNLVARQKEAYFKSNETNRLLGFSVVEGGVVLENSATSCSIDVFFPLSGPFVLNGGSLTLKKDLIFRSPLYLGSGTIDAGSYAIEFPHNVSTVQTPCSQHKDILSLIDQVDGITDINSIDWSFDSKYVAIGIDGANNDDELRIYYFDGEALTYTASYDFARKSIYSVRWHPFDYYLALGKNSNNELNILHLDVPSGALSLTDSANVSTVYAVAWHPDGTHIVVGQYNNNSLHVYPFSDGILGSSSSVNLGASRTVARNALDWANDGNYLAVGLYAKSGNDDLYVYSFDGANLTLNASLRLNQHVFAVGWRPNGTQLAVGVSGGSERLRLYNHNGQGGALTEITSARVGEIKPVYGLSWNRVGSLLATSRGSDSSGLEVKVFSYDTDAQALNLSTGSETSQTTESIRWAPNGNYLASGDRNDYLKIYTLVDTPLTFKNAKLFFSSDVTITTTVRFEGSCIVNASNNVIDVASGAMVVCDGSELFIEHAIIKGATANNIHCTDDSGILSLREVNLILDDDMTFSTGALLFEGQVCIEGEAAFAYQSMQTSTILAKSELELDAGITFSYDPIVIAEKNLLVFEDETSVLSLNGATLHTTVTGMDLTKGKMRIKRDAYCVAEIEEYDDHIVNVGFSFGNNNSSDDFRIDIYAGETVYCTHGKINYRNVQEDSLVFGSINSSLYLYPRVRLNLYQNMNLNPGFLTLANQSVIARVLGKKLVGSVRPLGKYFSIGLRP